MPGAAASKSAFTATVTTAGAPAAFVPVIVTVPLEAACGSSTGFTLIVIAVVGEQPAPALHGTSPPSETPAGGSTTIQFAEGTADHTRMPVPLLRTRTVARAASGPPSLRPRSAPETAPALRLLRDFDAHAAGGDLDDPWGHPRSAYVRAAREIEAAIPGILDELRSLLAARAAREG